MINILINGIGGKMGRKLLDAVNNISEFNIIAGVDKSAVADIAIPVFEDISDIKLPINCIIDFSRPEALDGLLKYAQTFKIPLVLAVTGYSDKQNDDIKNASNNIPIFLSGNMSLGIAVMCSLVKDAASKLFDGFDIEIVETHHNQKVDSPSGTAVMLAQSVNEGLDSPRHLTFGRNSLNEKRTKNEIGVHSLRGGTVVGEHSVSFFGNDETLTITHNAQSKTIFAIGALKAAQFIVCKENGLFGMKELFAK